MTIVDVGLEVYANDRQKVYIEAVNRLGSFRAADRELKLSSDTVRECIRRLEAKAVIQGFAPAFDMTHPVPDPLQISGLSTYYKATPTSPAQWVKSKINALRQGEALQATFDALAAKLPRIKPLASPSQTAKHLCNLYTITDYHLGMLSRRNETGSDWNVEIAEQLLYSCLVHMVTNAPKARVAVLSIQGDFFHSDALLPLTPTSGHVLEQDGSYSYMIKAGIRVLRRAIALMLETHDEVQFIMAEGNHDPASSAVFRNMFASFYEDEPRLKVDTTETPYYAFQFGKVMLAIHHGHLKKNEALPLTFAALFPVIWGATTKRYGNTGHKHHADEKEHGGMLMIQHPTISGRDNYAARGGWISERQATCITFHDVFGQVGRTIVTPEMLQEAA